MDESGLWKREHTLVGGCRTKRYIVCGNTATAARTKAMRDTTLLWIVPEQSVTKLTMKSTVFFFLEEADLAERLTLYRPFSHESVLDDWFESVLNDSVVLSATVYNMSKFHHPIVPNLVFLLLSSWVSQHAVIQTTNGFWVLKLFLTSYDFFCLQKLSSKGLATTARNFRSCVKSPHSSSLAVCASGSILSEVGITKVFKYGTSSLLDTSTLKLLKCCAQHTALELVLSPGIRRTFAPNLEQQQQQKKATTCWQSCLCSFLIERKANGVLTFTVNNSHSCFLLTTEKYHAQCGSNAPVWWLSLNFSTWC